MTTQTAERELDSLPICPHCGSPALADGKQCMAAWSATHFIPPDFCDLTTDQRWLVLSRVVMLTQRLQRLLPFTDHYKRLRRAHDRLGSLIAGQPLREDGRK